MGWKHQMMVVGTNLMPIGIPNLGCSEKETLFSANSSTVIQHGCESSMAMSQAVPEASPSSSRQLYSTMAHTPLPCKASVHQTCPWHLWVFGVSVLLGERHYSVESVFWELAGSWLIQSQVPIPGSWLVSPHENEATKSSQFDWSKDIILTGQNKATLIGHSCGALDRMGESLSPIGWNTTPGIPF